MGHAEERNASTYALFSSNQPSQLSSPTPGRRSTTSSYSRSSDDGVCSHCSSSRNNSTRQQKRASQPASPQPVSRTHSDKGIYTPPPPFTSPSVASSFIFSNSGSSISPLRRELSHLTPTEGIDAVTARAARHDIARRLSQLARRLTYDGGNIMNDVMLGNQLEQLEKVVGATLSPEPRKLERRSIFESPARSDDGSSSASPISSLFKSRFSDLSASLHREREAEKEPEEEPEQKKGMNAQQARKIILEMGKLNDELSAVVNNLKARQEESEHIQGLLIERAERAAQRIIFLQNRITYLEQELQENDDELQHLRICLKAVEIQMPPHPDKELQRCIATFKNDYQALKRKRAHRANLASAIGFDSPLLSSPTR